MLASQTIIFAAGDNRRFVGRSPGVEETVAQCLFQQAPTLSDLIERRSECLTFHLLPGDLFACSRTIYSEYESEEGLFEGALTLSIILKMEQLSGFRYNAALFALVAQSEGALFLESIPGSRLPEVELSDSSMFDIGRGCLAVDNRGFDRLRRAMEIHDCVAIAEAPNPMLFLAGFLSELDEDDRVRITFSVGSLFTQARPSKLLIYPRVTEKIRKSLLDAQVRTMTHADLANSNRVAT